MAYNDLLVDIESNYPQLAKLPVGAQYKKQDGNVAFVTQDDINRWTGSGNNRMSRLKALARRTAKRAFNTTADIAHGVMNYGM